MVIVLLIFNEIQNGFQEVKLAIGDKFLINDGQIIIINSLEILFGVYHDNQKGLNDKRT